MWALETIQERLVQLDFIEDSTIYDTLAGGAFEAIESTLPQASMLLRKKSSLWFEALEKTARCEGKIGLMDHTALILLLKTKRFDHWNFPDCEKRIQDVLRISYENFVGRKCANEEFMKRLPKSVLRKCDSQDVLFYQASFHQGSYKTFEALKIVFQDYIPRIQDLLIPVGLLGIFSVPSGGEVLAGFIVGYALSTLMEYCVHLYIAHATPAIKARLRTWGDLGQDMLRFSLEHSVHHGSVSQNYVEPFAPAVMSGEESWALRDATKAKVDQSLLKRGGDRLLQLVRASQYGLSSSNILRTHLFFLPFSILVILLTLVVTHLMGVDWGWPFAMGVLLIGELWIGTSAIYHPLLHRTRKYIHETQGVVMRMIFKTRISSFIARSHRMHHSLGGWVNQNLNPGADFIFGFSPITIEELVDLKKRDAPF